MCSHWNRAATDYEDQLYYNQHRWYVPGIRRYLTPDPIGFASDPFNQYAYAGLTPTVAIYPSGTMWVTGLPAGEDGSTGAGFFDWWSNGWTTSALGLNDLREKPGLRVGEFEAGAMAVVASLGVGLPSVAQSLEECPGAEAAAAEDAGGALVPMAHEEALNTGTIRTIAGYEVGGNAGLVGSTYNMNIWGLFKTDDAQGLGALANAFKAEAGAAGATDISISGNAIINTGIANMNPAIATRYGLSFSQVNPTTILLQGPVP